MEKKEEAIIHMMPLSFYKAGGVFTGNAKAMRYMVKKEVSDKETSEKEAEGDSERLAAYVWPGPFIFEATKDELKISESFELSEEGIDKACQWLKAAYTDKEDEYSADLSLLESGNRLK